MMNYRSPFLLLAGLLLLPVAVSASSLNIETDYRLRGVSFSNTDFDTKSSTDARSYYSQRVQVSLGGSFAPGVELRTRITALGIVGSTYTYVPVPYPNTTMTPYIENAYLTLTSLNGLPVDVIAGKQPLTYGDGLIVCDNGLGMNAFRIIGHVPFPIAWDMELMTAKITDNLRPDTDTDLYAGRGSFDWKKHHWELSYIRYINDSGYVYTQGATSDITREVFKNFYDIRVGRRDDLSSYDFELAKQMGYMTLSNNSNITLDGMGYVVKGELYGKNTRLGNVTARALLSINSGDDDPLTMGDDKSFSPDLTRRYDGMERAGYGQLFAATPMDGFFPMPAPYSGINTLSLGADFSPLYAWTFGVDYFLYSASVGPRGAPTASGFERLFGAEFSIGVEMDLSIKYVHSKYVTSSFTYNRYTPPKFDQFWPKSEPATRYQFEVSAKF